MPELPAFGAAMGTHVRTAARASVDASGSTSDRGGVV